MLRGAGLVVVSLGTGILLVGVLRLSANELKKWREITGIG